MFVIGLLITFIVLALIVDQMLFGTIFSTREDPDTQNTRRDNNFNNSFRNTFNDNKRTKSSFNTDSGFDIFGNFHTDNQPKITIQKSQQLKPKAGKRNINDYGVYVDYEEIQETR